MTEPKRVLARKARKSSRVACGCYVRTGERIIRTPDGRWRCAQCVIAAAAVKPSPPQQTRTTP